MSYQTKRKLLNSTVYIVLGLVITAVICITVATFVSMRSKSVQPQSDVQPSEIPPADGGNVNDGVPAGILTSDETPAASETPAPAGTNGGEQGSKTPPAEDETPAVLPVEPVYCMPATGTLLKVYSPELPIRSLTMNDYRTHVGVDIAAPAGTAVTALSDGVVLDIWSDPMMGMCLSIDHGDGLCSVYKNLDVIFPTGIVKGAEVHAGQIVAAVGNTSLIELADVDHLHFEVRLNGAHVDPGSYIDLSALMSSDVGED